MSFLVVACKKFPIAFSQSSTTKSFRQHKTSPGNDNQPEDIKWKKFGSEKLGSLDGFVDLNRSINSIFSSLIMKISVIFQTSNVSASNS